MSKHTTKPGKLSIIPFVEESVDGLVGDALPIISWSTSRNGRGRKRSVSRSRVLTEAHRAVQVYIQNLEATVAELKQLVRLTNF